ncbi:STY1053 family phage-associated protein [Burkholderia ubonensis]|uniref:STY1053 family phage-associated protein n=1 Tax=Burkholderia ubonensis TaxID=101571 RepID=UPI00075A13D0|nr:hypothetical protein [Burkholderia ubonensis]KWN75797.1 hypothetical protein WM23_01995 [Burkholderia ubonensis]
MPLINVVKAFTIRMIREGQEFEKRVEAGLQEVEDFIADHWYAKAHTGPLPEGVAAAPANPETAEPAITDPAPDAAPTKAAAKGGNK